MDGVVGGGLGHEDPAGSSITIIMSNTLTHTAREDKSSLSCVLCYGSTEKELHQWKYK